jgi:ferredoxin-NADP reductase
VSDGTRVHEYEAELVVARRDELADGVITLSFEEPTGRALPAWTPGAHVDLMLAPDLVRQYSLCSSPGDTHRWRVGVLRDPASRGGSQLVHDTLHAGSRVRVRGPRNHFALARAPRYQFIAGGIGVTPIIPMIESAQATGADWHLLYGGRERDSMAFLNELEANGDRVTIWPQDEKGLLDLRSVLGEPREDTLVYCCGPEGLLSAVETACAPWPAGALHIERFAAKAVTEDQLAGALGHFEVVCQASGITVSVSPDQTMFEALEAADISLMASCLEGTCGSCETPVLEGIPDHRDSVLTDDERAMNDRIFPCVSRSLSERLVLDL